jgi:hypothetical protein
VLDFHAVKDAAVGVDAYKQFPGGFEVAQNLCGIVHRISSPKVGDETCAESNTILVRQRFAVHPYVVGNGARRLRRFDVARSPALAEYSKFVGWLTLKRPESRAPTNRQLVDAPSVSSVADEARNSTRSPLFLNQLRDATGIPRADRMRCDYEKNYEHRVVHHVE